MVPMRPKSPTPALANLAIALLLLALAVLVLAILNRISTHSELISTSLAALNKMDNSDAITHFIAPCYERKSTSFNLCEVFRGAL